MDAHTLHQHKHTNAHIHTDTGKVIYTRHLYSAFTVTLASYFPLPELTQPHTYTTDPYTQPELYSTSTFCW